MDWKVDYYVNENGESPVEDFIKTLPSKHKAKVIWELDIAKANMDDYKGRVKNV